MTERTCVLCGELKPITAFHRHGPGKWHYRCAECRSSQRRPRERRKPKTPEDRRRLKYGMAPGEYDGMHAAQGGLCSVCQEDPGYPLVVDHCHESGRVRALLCIPCNLRVGMYETYGARVAEYLSRFAT